MKQTYSIFEVVIFLFTAVSIAAFIVYKLSYAIGIYVANH